MYTILGATGHIGSVITRALLQKGEKVRVAGRNAARLKPLVDLGAEAVVADQADPEALTRLLTGARAAFLLVPPSMTSPDYRAEQERYSMALAAAAQKSGLQYAVHLSSIGAHSPSGTGPIAGLHRGEKMLDAVDRLNVLHLRPAYFMENHLAAIGMIQMMGIYGGALRADMKFPQIATRDIAGYAAERLLKLDFNGNQTQELLGERDVTMSEAAAAIAGAIRKPELRYAQFPYEQVEQVLIQMGIPPKSAAYMVEMFHGFNDGLTAPVEPRSAANTTPTSVETFAKEVFAPAYQGQAVGA